MPTVINEPIRTAEYLISEVNTYQSREVGLITGAADLQAGTVLGRQSATPNKLALLNPAATDGTQVAAAILYQAAPVSQGDQRRTITARLTEVNGLLLTWPAGITAVQQAAAVTQLNGLFILVRT